MVDDIPDQKPPSPQPAMFAVHKQVFKIADRLGGSCPLVQHAHAETDYFVVLRREAGEDRG